MTAELLGVVVGLFVQRRPLKRGKAPLREYRTDDIVAVSSLIVDSDGVSGITAAGETILDVHHRHHPDSRDRRGTSGVSVMATGDYARLRARYGDHLVDGSAGCTVLIENAAGLAGRDLSAGLRFETAAGSVHLHSVLVADPCVEFSRFCLQLPPSVTVGEDVRQALVDLDEGNRGFKGIAGQAGQITTGDSLRLLLCDNV